MSKQTESFPSPMFHGDKAINDIKELPAAFNSFFTSVFCSNSPNSISPYSLSAYAPLISSIYLTPNDVLTALLNLKPKYNSPDGIPAFFLKIVAAFLVPPLTVIFNYSLQSASLHQDWSHALVSPIFKGRSSVNDITNYRLISCISISGKILESLVKEHLLTHFMANGLISNAQFGFLPGRSTTSNLLITDHLINKELSTGKAVDVVFFVVSKAFDTVPHSTLLHKISNSFGVVGKLHVWLKSFLTGRTQYVKINSIIYSNLFSQSSSVTSGVIQGSVLGPLLYAADTNDIIRCFSYGHPILYVDDLKVIFPIDPSNFPKSFSLIMNDLNTLSAWSEFYGQWFNFAKCAVLHFGAKNPNFVYNVNYHVLPSSESVQDLSVTRNTKLSYEEHCVNIIRCTNCTCSRILRTFASRNSSFMVKVFIANVRPILKYASQLWSPSNVNLINRVERVQKLFTKCIQSVAHLPYNERLNM